MCPSVPSGRGKQGTWHDRTWAGRSQHRWTRYAELLGVDLATVQRLATKVEPYVRVDGTKVWSLMQLERQLRPEAYRRRRGGYLDRRRTPTADAEAKPGAAGRATLLILSQQPT